MLCRVRYRYATRFECDDARSNQCVHSHAELSFKFRQASSLHKLQCIYYRRAPRFRTSSKSAVNCPGKVTAPGEPDRYVLPP